MGPIKVLCSALFVCLTLSLTSCMNSPAYTAAQQPQAASSPTSNSSPSSNPPTSTNPTTPPATVASIYVPTSGTTGLGTTGYNIDGNSGHLRKIGDFAIDGLSGYTSDPQHRIYIRNGGPSMCDRGNCTQDTVLSTVVRNTATGMLSVGMNNVVVAKQFNGVAIVPSAKFAYAVELVQPDDPTTYRIRGFRIDQTSGTLTQIDIGDVPVGNWGPLFAHPKLPFLYAFEDRCCAVAPVTKLHVWSVDDNTGRVMELNTSPTTLAKPTEFFPTISNDGTYFYAAMPTADSEIDVTGMGVNGVPQSQPLASVATQVFPEFETFLVHPGGTIVYGWGWHHNADLTQTATVHAYRFDANTNSFSDLDLSAKVPRPDLMPLGFDASGKYFYLGKSSDLPIVLYSVDQNTGDLAFVSNEPAN